MNTRGPRVLAFLVAVALLGLGCRPRALPGTGRGGPAESPAASVSGTLDIFIPCGLAGPYGEIVKAFCAKYPHVRVKQEMANIDVQTKLLAAGKATPDLWLALGDRETARVAQAGRLDGKPITFAYNSLAFMVARGNPLGLASVQDLLQPSVKTLALATAENSSGYYGEQALRKAGVWDKLQRKLWRTDQPALIKGQLASGKAEVGVVYYPCAREVKVIGGRPQELPGKLQLLNKLPEALGGTFPAQAAVLKGAANPQAARVFIQFLLTDAGQEIWEKWAFDRAKPPTTGHHAALYLYGAASLRPLLDEAVAQFRTVNPEVSLDVGYAEPGCLFEQLTFGQRGDLYVPGDDAALQQAAARGLLTPQRPVGFQAPVLLVAKGNPRQIKSVADLARPGLKVVIGDPRTCAVGRVAETVLKQAGQLDKATRNLGPRAGSEAELGNAVKLGTADVAVVWPGTATQLRQDCDCVPLSRDLCPPAPVAVGLLKCSRHRAEAQAFADFLAGPRGQEIVRASGLTGAEGK